MKIDRSLSITQRGFTLIEMLVVISIILLLIGILLPALKHARETGRMSVCLSNMRQWNTAVLAYANDHEDFLPKPAKETATGNATPGTWFNELPPYINYKRYEVVFPGTAVELKDVYDQQSIWFCPSRVAELKFLSGTGKNCFHYGMNTVLDGSGTHPPTPSSLSKNRHISLYRITKQSQTVFMSEPYNNVEYVQPNSIGGSEGNVQWDRHASSRVNVSFFDMHVETLESQQGVNELTSDSPKYVNDDLNLIWGAF